MTDLHARLDTVLRERLAVARAATPGPWSVNEDATVVYSGDYDRQVVAGGRWGGEASVFESDDDAVHIALHDPLDAIARYEAGLRVLERHKPVGIWTPETDVNATSQHCQHGWVERPRGPVPALALWPCDEVLDLAASLQVEAPDE